MVKRQVIDQKRLEESKEKLIYLEIKNRKLKLRSRNALNRLENTVESYKVKEYEQGLEESNMVDVMYLLTLNIQYRYTVIKQSLKN